MPMPNFLVIGAAKSGTTALYDTLKQHPQIFMSPLKEPQFFAYEGERPAYCGPGDPELFNPRVVFRLEDYQRLFDGLRAQPAAGEASVHYLMRSELSAERIRRHIPRARLIAILRQPADRAYSYYIMLRSQGRERLSFTRALAAEPERARRNWAYYWQYRATGFYHRQLQSYLERFPREQIRIFLYEDWNSRPLDVLRDIFRFLGVDDSFVPQLVRSNVGYLPRSQSIRTLIQSTHPLKARFKPLLPLRIRTALVSGLRKLNRSSPPPLDPELRRQLTADFRDDILRLQDLLGRDLSHWLQA